jgi:catechol-2,3-dioxygenase
MQFESLTLCTPDPATLLPFYTEVLGLPGLVDDEGSLQVRAGTTRLIFRPGPESRYHYAFNIPENQLAAAQVWLAARTAIAHNAQGKEIFSFENWNAHALYFFDPAGNILELIARHTLPNASDTPFSAASLLSISEIGLAVPDVPATVAELGRELEITAYRGEAGDEFTAVGDEHALFIVVKRGRIWFPDTGFPALAVPLIAVVSAANGVRRTVSAPVQDGALLVSLEGH